MIHVRDRNLAGGAERDRSIVLGHIMHCRRTDHGRVVRPMDCERHLLLGAVKRGQREGIDPGVAGAEILNRAVEDSVDVGTVDSHHQRADVTAAGLHRRPERGLPLIGVDDRDRAGGIKNETVGILGHVVDRRRADDGCVVRAMDGKGHLLAGAVESGHRERIDLDLTGPEVLQGAVRNRVGVCAVGRQHEAAQVARRRYHGSAKRGLPMVRICNRNRSRGGQCRIARILRDVVNRRGADHGGVVNAVHVERNLFGRAIQRRYREGIGLDLAGSEILRRAVGYRIGVAAVFLEDEGSEISRCRQHRRIE